MIKISRKYKIVSLIDVVTYLFDAYTMLTVSKYFVCIMFQGKSLIIPKFNDFGYRTFFYPFLEKSCSLLDGNIMNYHRQVSHKTFDRRFATSLCPAQKDSP
jgi:hypothetical protein